MTLAFGARSMTEPLRACSCARRRRPTRVRWREYGWRAEPDLAAAVAEHEALREILEGAGAEVIVTEGERGNPDAIYAYDPLLVGERGQCCSGRARTSGWARPAALEDDLAEAGIPIAGRIEAPGTIDGGDTLWLDRETLLVGRGYRTNAAGVEQLAAALPRRRGALYDLPHWNGRAEVMHLMSLISPLDDDLALVYPRLAPVRLIELLQSAGSSSSRSRTRSSRRWARTCSRSARVMRSRSRGTTRRDAGWRPQASRC